MRVTHSPSHDQGTRPSTKSHAGEADATAPSSQDVATDPVARILGMFMGASSAAPAAGSVPGPLHRIEH